jgi:DNA-directed RNA polymerase subunit RPC12/RpoP
MEQPSRCHVCRCFVDHEDLFCANCGTENPQADKEAQRVAATASLHSFRCENCAASMSYDASAQALRCPFCGSQKLHAQTGSRTVLPKGILPFQINSQAAQTILHTWLSQGFWRPGDAARASTIGKMTAVFVPYWIFSAETHTYWTADSSATPAGARGNWVPVSGEHRGNHRGLLVSGSSTLTPQETDAIAPFDLAKLQPPEKLSLTNWIVEEFRVSRKAARPAAQALLERLDSGACQRYVAGSCRNLKVNVRVSGLHGEPALLPVWILAYQYRQRIYRVLINGQTGKIAGDAPFSYLKLFAVVAVSVLLLLFFLLVVALGNR